MQLFSTEIMAVCPIKGDTTKFCGPNIRAWNAKEAFDYCQSNGLGYCHVNGDVVVCEIPTKDDVSFEPDWEKMVDYEIQESPENKRIYMDNAFKNWLTEKEIEWHPDEGSINAIWVQEKNLLPFEKELREKFPEFKFFSNVLREDAEPKSPNN